MNPSFQNILFSILFLLFCYNASGQSTIGLKVDLTSIEEINFKHPTKVKFNLLTPKPTFYSSASILDVPNIFNYHDLGFFCKVDLRLEKTFKMPVRFRLGTVEAVDFLERKGPTQYNY